MLRSFIGAFLGVIVGVIVGIVISAICSWYSFKKWGEISNIAVFTIYCRRSKYFSWLAWNVWGDDNWYYDKVEKRLAEYKNGRRNYE